MWQLSARNIAEVSKTIPEPVFVISIGTGPPINISTRGPTTWSGVTFEQGFLEIDEIKYGDYGDHVAKVRISSAFLDTLLSQELIEKSIVIGLLWGQPPYAADDLVTLFDGVIESGRYGRQTIDLVCVNVNAYATTVPQVFYEHQNLQPAGTTVTIRTNTYVIQRAD